MFIHLNIHTNYSKMYSANTFRDYLYAVKKLNMPYLAITEVNGLWGFIHFMNLAKDYGIKPIAGSNIITENHEVLLLVRNQIGFSNLCKIYFLDTISKSFDYYKEQREENVEDPNISESDVRGKKLKKSDDFQNIKKLSKISYISTIEMKNFIRRVVEYDPSGDLEKTPRIFLENIHTKL